MVTKILTPPHLSKLFQKRFKEIKYINLSKLFQKRFKEIKKASKGLGPKGF